MQTPPMVFLIDDEGTFSDSLVNLVSSVGLQVVRFGSGREFLQNLNDDRIGCVVIDLGKPHLEGMRVIDELARKPRSTPVIVLTDTADVPSVVQAVRHGVVAFLQKSHAGKTEIIEAIQSAINLDSQQWAIDKRAKEIQSRFASLNDREADVLRRLKNGDEILDIAMALNVSRRTVENRRTRMMEKLQVTSFPALIALSKEYDEFDQSM